MASHTSSYEAQETETLDKGDGAGEAASTESILKFDKGPVIFTLKTSCARAFASKSECGKHRQRATTLALQISRTPTCLISDNTSFPYFLS